MRFRSAVRHSSREVVLGAFLFVLGGLAKPSAAETIYLKSGLSISVTRTQEQNGEILYWIGGDQYTISKDSVLKIEAGDAPVAKGSYGGSYRAGSGVQDLTRRDSPSSPTQGKVKIQAPAGPKQNDAYWTGLRNRIMVRDTIDD